MKTLLVIMIFFNILSTVLSECTCEPDEENRNKTEAMKFKLIALASILVAGAIGVGLPFLGKIIPALSPERDIFFLIKAFAAGVILSTGLIHVLPDAFDSLTSPCLKESPWGEFPFTGLVAMVAALGTLMFECHATAYQRRSELKKGGIVAGDGEVEHESGGGGGGGHFSHVHAHTHASHGHAHGSVVVPIETASDAGLSSEVNRFRIVSKVLELGIIVHSVIIGLSLGASESPKTIKPLVAALTFHQFFEGMGLGGCISQAKFKSISAAIMGAFFALTTPLGIVLGILVTRSYDENSSTALIVEGTLNAASAGILIYMALVDLLSADFMNPKIQSNIKLHLSANVFLLLGVGCMTILAKWA